MLRERRQQGCLLKYQRKAYLVNNMHKLPASGHHVDRDVTASKLLCIEIYNKDLGFIDTSDKIANSDSMSH